MTQIFNLTQHTATKEQIESGVVDLPEPERQELQRLLTFQASELVGLSDSLQREFISARARAIVNRFVLPRVLESARRILYEGGYVTTGLSAFSMLRPNIAANGLKAMIGGAPWLMRPLIEELERIGVQPVFAVSDRVTVEEIQPDGSVKKTAIFKHVGFVTAV